MILLHTNCTSLSTTEKQQHLNIQQVANTEGLIAFWDFDYVKDGSWTSYYDAASISQSFPLYLRRIGDEQSYTKANWPYTDSNSIVQFDESGPFGNAAGFNQGYIYGAVPRSEFDGTGLDLHGYKPFTIIAWVKFIGKRHMVAGIWDEGGWHKYAGRRQVALFAGLFNQKGVIAHLSATGAASYPQSTIEGAQYARRRAIDGQPFEDNQWVAMAMTYDPEKKEVVAWLNGQMTPLRLSDPVTQDVYQYENEQVANPFHFESPIYSPRAFILKYNGYSLEKDGVSEHRLQVDLDKGALTYWQDSPEATQSAPSYRIRFDIKREGKNILEEPILVQLINGQTIALPSNFQVYNNDQLWTSLEVEEKGEWKQVGTNLTSRITDGAPFTFGRALGLASEELDHGSQLYLDGVAVFNRVLKEGELRKLSFFEPFLTQ